MLLLFLCVFNWDCNVFTLFRAYLALFYFKFSHSNFKFNSQNIELFTNWHFHYSNVFRLEKLHGYTYTRLWLRYIEKDWDREKKKTTSEWIQFKAQIHSLYQFAHTQFYCIGIQRRFIALLFRVDHEKFPNKTNINSPKTMNANFKVWRKKKAFRNYNLSKHIVEKRNGIEI